MSKPITPPTTTNVSDLINAMWKFTDENPLWHENRDQLGRMSAAYSILTTLCDPIDLTEEEFSFVIGIFETCKENEIP
jgi:hypothetical protein